MRKPNGVNIEPAELEKLAGMLTNEQIAMFYGITREALQKRLRRHAPLRVALDKGRALALTMVAGSLLRKVRDGDTASIIFYLKTRGGWSEKHQDAETELLKAQAKLTKATAEAARSELERVGIRIPQYSQEPAPECPQKTH